MNDRAANLAVDGMNRAPMPEDGIARLRANFSRWRVPAGLIDELADRQAAVKYPHGATVFVEGSLGDLFGCVLSGYVKVYCNRSGGKAVLVRMAGPGDIIGFADYEDSRGRRSKIFEARAFTNCSVALFTREHAVRLLRAAGPERLIELFQSLNTYWSSTLHWWASLMGMPFEGRLETIMADLAARLGRRDNRGTLIIPELSQGDLAEMIGGSRPLVSRLVNRMERRGLIERRGRRYVLSGGWESNRWGYAHISGPIGEERRSVEPRPPRRERAAAIDPAAECAEAMGILRSAGRN
ncbi:MAG: Crp/Fnr family transcriptional regulator [Candidatus Binataceae bacterium]